MKRRSKDKDGIKEGLTIKSFGRAIPVVFYGFLAIALIVVGLNFKKAVGGFFNKKHKITLVSEKNEIISVEEQKLIMISIPKVDIIQHNIVAGSIEYLNNASKDKVDDIREKCEEDLLEKTDKHRVVDMARENINNSIQTLAGVVLKSDEYEKYSDYTINLYNSY